MKRNAISQWELSDRFWAESDPPEPLAAAGFTSTAAKGLLRKCVRQLDRLTVDNKRAKYRLAAVTTTTKTTTADSRPRRKSIDHDGGHRRRAPDTLFVADADDDDKHMTPPCVIKRATHRTETFQTVPYREVSV